MNIDWDICFICQKQGKDKIRSTLQGIKSLATNLYGFWQIESGVLDALRLNVLPAVQNETELEEYLISQKAKYHKVCSNRYDSQKLQRYKDSQNSNTSPLSFFSKEKQIYSVLCYLQ